MRQHPIVLARGRDFREKESHDSDREHPHDRTQSLCPEENNKPQKQFIGTQANGFITISTMLTHPDSFPRLRSFRKYTAPSQINYLVYHIMSEKKIIAIVGATGTQGGSVAKAFLAHPSEWTVRGLTRNPTSPSALALADQGAELVTASLDDPDSLKKAFEGAHVVF